MQSFKFMLLLLCCWQIAGWGPFRSSSCDRYTHTHKITLIRHRYDFKKDTTPSHTHLIHRITRWVQLAMGLAHKNLPGRRKLEKKNRNQHENEHPGGTPACWWLFCAKKINSHDSVHITGLAHGLQAVVRHSLAWQLPLDVPQTAAGCKKKTHTHCDWYVVESCWKSHLLFSTHKKKKTSPECVLVVKVVRMRSAVRR